jgi:hypothetical protein
MKIQSKVGLVVTVAVVATAGIVVTKAAQAGAKRDYPLVCDDSSRSCSGSMGTVRADSSTKALISIEMFGQAPPQGTVGWAYVYIRDSAGTTRQCRIGGDRQGLIEAARYATADSWVSVEWDSIGDCSSLSVENGSYIRPTTL